MMSNLAGHRRGRARSLTRVVCFVSDEGLLSEHGHSWESEREGGGLGPAKTQVDRHQKVHPGSHEVIF